jgi:hypothetical protein
MFDRAPSRKFVAYSGDGYSFRYGICLRAGAVAGMLTVLLSYWTNATCGEFERSARGLTVLFRVAFFSLLNGLLLLHNLHIPANEDKWLGGGGISPQDSLSLLILKVRTLIDDTSPTIVFLYSPPSGSYGTTMLPNAKATSWSAVEVFKGVRGRIRGISSRR